MMTHEEVIKFMVVIQQLGYAVVVFTPDELRGVSSDTVEEAMIETGNLMIDWNAEEDG
jgi:hypothetical protein